nr:hypothetical protein [Rhizobium laguerreae]
MKRFGLCLFGSTLTASGFEVDFLKLNIDFINLPAARHGGAFLHGIGVAAGGALEGRRMRGEALGARHVFNFAVVLLPAFQAPFPIVVREPQPAKAADHIEQDMRLVGAVSAQAAAVLLQMLREGLRGSVVQHAFNRDVAVNLGGKVEAFTEERAIEDYFNLPVSKAEEGRPPIRLGGAAVERNSHDAVRFELLGIVFCAFDGGREADRSQTACLGLPVLDDVGDNSATGNQVFKLCFDKVAVAHANAGKVQTGRRERAVFLEAAVFNEPTQRRPHNHRIPDIAKRLAVEPFRRSGQAYQPGAEILVMLSDKSPAGGHAQMRFIDHDVIGRDLAQAVFQGRDRGNKDPVIRVIVVAGGDVGKGNAEFFERLRCLRNQIDTMNAEDHSLVILEQAPN